MFGKRSVSEPAVVKQPAVASGAKPADTSPRAGAAPASPVQAQKNEVAAQQAKAAAWAADTRSEDYYNIKSTIFNALIDTIDLAQLAQLDPDSAREEIRDIVNEIIS
ncbi:MAG TPA: hypothetical protein VHZ32_08045, partial [Rhizomicrobium sp.]|nr:hypothetical protein [Rhizomicrobium sp.]